MKKLRVIVLMHEELIPPDSLEGVPEKEQNRWISEYDVCNALRNLGHEILKLGLHDDIRPLRQAVESFRPDIVFNLLEEFRGEAVLDHAVASYFELLRLPYTGANPRAMILARDKALTKKILRFHGIRAPQFQVFPQKRKVKRTKDVEFPLIVKSLVEEASMGISQASIVTSDEKLAERVEFIHESVGTAAIAEQYIRGREFYAGMIGNEKPQVLPIWELRMTKMPAGAHRIATARVKWDEDYQKQYDIHIGRARRLAPKLVKHIERTSRQIFQLLSLSGYARLDYRYDGDELYLLEANPNPDISYDQELAYAAEAAGISYEELIQKVLQLGLRRARETP